MIDELMNLCIINKKEAFAEIKFLEEDCNYQLSLVGGIEDNLPTIYKFTLFLVKELDPYTKIEERDKMVYKIRRISEHALRIAYQLIDRDYISFDDISQPRMFDICNAIKYLISRTSLSLDSDLLHDIFPIEKDLNYVKNFIGGSISLYERKKCKL